MFTLSLAEKQWLRQISLWHGRSVQGQELEIAAGRIVEPYCTLLENWTSESPDSNSIQNLWPILTSQVIETVPITIAELANLIIDRWTLIREDAEWTRKNLVPDLHSLSIIFEIFYLRTICQYSLVHEAIGVINNSSITIIKQFFILARSVYLQIFPNLFADFVFEAGTLLWILRSRDWSFVNPLIHFHSI
jgi:hypothetical protein